MSNYLMREAVEAVEAGMPYLEIYHRKDTYMIQAHRRNLGEASREQVSRLIGRFIKDLQ